MKPEIGDFHGFINGRFKEQLLARYKKHKILTEADLQAYASEFLRKFFRRNDPTRKRFKVLNKPFFKEIGIHPDIAVFKREKPWVLFEIKEWQKLPVRVARKERGRLIKAKTLGAPPKRAYLLYAIRYGRKKVLRGPKAEGARYFFEIPIVLQLNWPKEKIKRWERERKKWSRYGSKPSRRDSD